MRGRKPLPTEIKKKKGTLQKCRTLEDEVQPETVSEAPPAPVWLSEIGKQEWDRVIDYLISNNLLASCDLSIVAFYCNEVSVYIESEQQLRQNSRMIAYKDEKGKIKHAQQVPLQIIARKSLESAMKIAAEFGFTPSSRTRIGTQGQNTSEQDPFTKILELKKQRAAKKANASG
jgi:P27 family predicted phage terminase small subunit